MNRHVPTSILLLCSTLISQAVAEVVTIDVTVKAVDVAGRTITVTKLSKTKAKDIELEVGKTAKILAGRDEVSLESIRPGQKATVSYETELEVVTKIEINGAGSGQKKGLNEQKSLKGQRGKSDSSEQPHLELVEVSELSPDAEHALYPSLSEDGLTIYWEGPKSTVWTAHRETPDSLFADKTKLLAGRQPTVSQDQLDIVLLGRRTDGQDGESFHIAKRDSAEKPFGRPAEIAELRTTGGDLKNASLSADGLTLHFNRFSGKQSTLMFSNRNSRTARWGKPIPVPLAGDEASGNLSWPFVSTDSRLLFCVGENEQSSLMIWKRNQTTKPFDQGEYIVLDDVAALLARSPRYVAATKELFFSRGIDTPKGPTPKKWSIWIIKNFDPASTEK
jgi:hypothetical protein